MKSLTQVQLAKLTGLFHRGAADASTALTKWLERDTTIQNDRIEQVSLDQAADMLGASEMPCCACIMGVQGFITGKLLFCFDDASGWQLCRYLLNDDSAGTTEASHWTELQTSAALETANIVGSAYVSSLATTISSGPLMPTPPQFVRDYAASLIEFAVMDQAMAMEQVLFAKTQFQIEKTPIHWSLLLIPDPASLEVLSSWLEGNTQSSQIQVTL